MGRTCFTCKHWADCRKILDTIQGGRECNSHEFSFKTPRFSKKKRQELNQIMESIERAKQLWKGTERFWLSYPMFTGSSAFAVKTVKISEDISLGDYVSEKPTELLPLLSIGYEKARSTMELYCPNCGNRFIDKVAKGDQFPCPVCKTLMEVNDATILTSDLR